MYLSQGYFCTYFQFDWAITGNVRSRFDGKQFDRYREKYFFFKEIFMSFGTTAKRYIWDLWVLVPNILMDMDGLKRLLRCSICHEEKIRSKKKLFSLFSFTPFKEEKVIELPEKRIAAAADRSGKTARKSLPRESSLTLSLFFFLSFFLFMRGNSPAANRFRSDERRVGRKVFFDLTNASKRAPLFPAATKSRVCP